MNAINMLDPRLKPATAAEIENALRLLVNALKTPDGLDFSALLAGYQVALEGFPKWAIANAARKFLRGDVGGQSTVFCPLPPKLAEAVKIEMAPVYRQVDRENAKARIRREAAEFESKVVRTPEARRHISASYAAFCAAYVKTSPHSASVRLDPSLIEQVPDAPTTWERLRWEERGGNRG